jgi:hypothetical protein
MFSTPVTISNRTPPTIISSETRSSTFAADRAGGHVNRRIMIRPRPTCNP